MSIRNFMRRGAPKPNVILKSIEPNEEQLAIIEVTKMQALLHGLAQGSDGVYKRTDETTTDGKYRLYTRAVN